MSDYPRPARSTLISNAQNDLNSRIEGADSRLRRAILNGLSVMSGLGQDAMYGYLAWVADQLFPDTAVETFLLRWAKIWDLTPKAASFASDSATGQGPNTNGRTMPAGTVLQDGLGNTYVTTAAMVVAGGAIDVPYTAQTAGSAGNLAAGTILTVVEPIAGIASTFTVDGTDPTEGDDAETPDELLGRLLQRIRNPPLGGGRGDYERWALMQPGVTRAWEAPLWMGLGTVGIFFVYDDRDDIFPLDADVAAMQAWLVSVAPVTAVVYALAPTPVTKNFSITITPTGDAGVEAAIQAELTDYFQRSADALGTVLYRSQYEQAIGLAGGLVDHTTTAPAANITPAAGQLPVLGTVHFS